MKEELFGIVSQMRRCAVSIPCNTSEGYCRNHRKEYLHFLNVAIGSRVELETLLSLSKDPADLSDKDSETLCDGREEVSKLLWILAASLRKKDAA
jgi:four helix bundle protein